MESTTDPTAGAFFPGRPTAPGLAGRALATLAAAAALSGTAHAADPAPDFNRDVRPLLSEYCFACHGPDAHDRKGDLRLDTEAGSRADLGDGAAAVVPGHPDRSELVARIFHPDPEERMPPGKTGKSPSAGEKETLRRWIAAGGAYAAPWAYVPPRRHAPPPVPEAQAGWPRNGIDRFILGRLVTEGLKPSPDADPVTLVRRLTFDLTGLPPEPEMVDSFTAAYRADPEKAIGRLADHLLASDRYGERMAAYWLDLVRYADTVGYHGDQDHNISPYRDYVIDAFNDNLPFDQFTREQLAGDLVPGAGVDQKIASGYNRLLQTSHEGGVQAKEYLAIYQADRVRNVSAVWMGGTLGCAQCHDHKFDPYTAKDFYAMGAFFADLDEAQHFKVGSNALPTRRPPEIKVLTKRERGRVAELEVAIARERDSGRAAALRAEKEAIEKNARTTMISVALKEPRTVRVLPRGNWLDDSGPVVEPAVPEFLGQVGARGRATRLDLANWLTDPDPAKGTGGLTARVFVNRLWYLFFGSGLAGNLDDFGGQGEPPVYPELLDNLALEFVRTGWDVKHMVRFIVTSRAYRQSSLAPADLHRRDPYNRLYARQSRHRLPAEMIRDNILAVAGLLVLDYGGASVKPYQPAGYFRHLNFPQRKYQHHGDARQWRRGVYVHWQRQFLHPMLRAMDAPTREECTAQRPRSNTPTAALCLLNDPTFVEAARAFAARVLGDGGGTFASRLGHAFKLALSRPPDAEESRILGDLLASAEKEYRSNPAAAGELIGVGLASKPEGHDPVELAAWTAVARAILNLNETVTRN